MHPSHVHPRPSSGAERSALKRALGVTAALIVAEVVGGVLANSLALLSDAGHMLTDLLALGLAVAAISFAGRPATSRRTFGYYRLEILSALVNGILLALFAVWILIEAYERFQDPPVVRLEILAPVALAGLLANLLAFRWLRNARGGLGTRAALWHTAADGASSLLVILSAGAMAVTSWWWIDPAISLVLAGILVFGAFRLLWESAEVLLESVPGDLDLTAVETAMVRVEGVDAVHDLHVWSLTSEVRALAGHLRVAPARLREADRIIAETRALLVERFRIAHTTLQVESTGCGPVCVLGLEEGNPAAAGESFQSGRRE